jgi:hypothetical protein
MIQMTDIVITGAAFLIAGVIAWRNYVARRAFINALLADIAANDVLIAKAIETQHKESRT